MVLTERGAADMTDSELFNDVCERVRALRDLHHAAQELYIAKGHDEFHRAAPDLEQWMYYLTWSHVILGLCTVFDEPTISGHKTRGLPALIERLQGGDACPHRSASGALAARVAGARWARDQSIAHHDLKAPSTYPDTSWESLDKLLGDTSELLNEIGHSRKWQHQRFDMFLTEEASTLRAVLSRGLALSPSASSCSTSAISAPPR